MQEIQYEVTINATPERVWNVMLADATYRDWTSQFCPGSYFEGDWSEGSTIRFLGPDPNTGELGGMVSRIEKHDHPRHLVIKHVGVVSNGENVFEGPEVEAWAPSLEEYFFEPTPGGTLLTVRTDTADSYVDYFNETWPKALARLKELAEPG